MTLRVDGRKWQRRVTVLHRRLTDGVVLLPPGRSEPFVVTGPGAVVWQLLEEPIDIEDASLVLAELFDVDSDVVAADLVPLFDELHRLGAIGATDEQQE